MTWLHYLKDCAEINKMLNASIKSLSTIHYPLATIHYSLSPAPAPYDDTDHTGRNRGVSGKLERAQRSLYPEGFQKSAARC